MKIKDVLNLSPGDVFKTEGEIVYTKKPKEFKSEKVTFYSQFVLLKDDSCGEKESLPLAITFNKPEDTLENGIKLKIKGSVREYNGNNQYDGKIIERGFDVIEKTDTPNIPKSNSNHNGNGNGSKDNYWENKFEWEKEVWKFNRAGMSRSNGVQFAVNYMDILIKNKVIKPKDEAEIRALLWEYVTGFSKYIFDGKKPKTTILENLKDTFGGEVEEVAEEGNADWEFAEEQVSSRG